MKAPSFAMITGHQFGVAVLKGMLSTAVFKEGKLLCKTIYCLHPSKGLNVVGYEDAGHTARENKLRYVYFADAKSDNLYEDCRKCPPDYLLVFGLSQLVPSKLLDLPSTIGGGSTRHSQSYGSLGVHPTLLPLGRGRAPIPWSILLGIRESGVTCFLLSEEADAGPIIDVEPFHIDFADDASSVFDKAWAAHCNIGVRLAPVLASRHLTWVPQNHSEATYWEQRRPSDGWLNFSKPADELHVLIKSLAPPYPMAFFFVEHMLYRVLRSSIVGSSHGVPGEILEILEGRKLLVRCGRSALLLELHEPIGPQAQLQGYIITSESTKL